MVLCLEHVVDAPRVHEGNVFVNDHQPSGLVLACLHLADDVFELEFVECTIHAHLVVEVLVCQGGEERTFMIVQLPSAYSKADGCESS